MFSSPHYDVLVIGAGILGLTTAYHIKKKNPEKKVLVIDKLNASGQGNTAKSGGMFRSFFYSRTNFELADSSIEFYKYIEEKGVKLGIKWIGYLWLFNEEDFKKIEEILKEMERYGGKFTIYNKKELKEKLKINIRAAETEEGKIMNLSNIDVGLFVPKAGKIDVEKLVEFYEKEYKRIKGEVIYGVEAKKLIVKPIKPLKMPGEPYFWQESTITGVETSRGVIEADKIVIAAGVWSSKLLDPIGVDSYSKPKKRQIFVIKAEKDKLLKLLKTPGFNKYNCIPFTILPRPKVFVRPDLEEKSFWTGYADEFNRAFKLEEDPQPEENYYRYGIYPILSTYLPQFSDEHPINAWAGQYAINTLDHQPVIFEENNLIVVGASSGSGIMKADAIGRIAAALYYGEEEAELFGEKWFKVSDLGIEKRRVEREKFVI